MRQIETNRQNEHVVRSLVQAQHCITALAREGFTVLGARIEGHKPVVWVQNSARCAQLDGGMMLRRSGPGGPQVTMAADRDGCQVQWLVVSH